MILRSPEEQTQRDLELLSQTVALLRDPTPLPARGLRKSAPEANVRAWEMILACPSRPDWAEDSTLPPRP